MTLEAKVIFVEEHTAFLHEDPLAGIALEGINRVTRLSGSADEIAAKLEGLKPAEVAAVVLPSWDDTYVGGYASFGRVISVVGRALKAGHNLNKFIIYTGTPTADFADVDNLVGVAVMHRTEPKDTLVLGPVLKLYLAVSDYAQSHQRQLGNGSP